MSRRARRHVPGGGAATINGVVYQMLWSLVRAARAHLSVATTSADGQLEGITLTLEPPGGGGDLLVAAPGRRVVEQLKARSDGGPWSLREIVEGVIPDLYLGMGAQSDQTEFRFVTEGRMGRWKQVYEFFQSLKGQSCPADDVLSALNESVELEFGGAGDAGSESFWDRKPYTARRLFERIVAEVRKRKPVRDREDACTTQRNLWYVLGHFEFVGGQSLAALRDEIDAHLLAVIDRQDRLAQVRDALAFDLAQLATAGGAVIDASEFFARHNLDAVPLSDWSRMRSESQRHLRRYLAGGDRYDPERDVRSAAAQRMLHTWAPVTPMLAVSGESGQGKSWHAFAMALHGLHSQNLVVAIDATGTCNATLDSAARALWQDIAGHDESIALPRIAQRVKRVTRTSITPWLMLVIDGVQEAAEAVDLARQPWEEWGIRVVLTCQPQVARKLEQAARGRCVVMSADDFSNHELHAYLELSLGERWADIPEYVRAPLRRPLLAKVYCSIANDPQWRPENEYDLYSAFWNKLDEDGLDHHRLKSLAQRLLDGASYPWSDYDLAAAGVDGPALKRLEKVGWIRTLREAAGLRVEMAHDRLLNWCVAVRLLDDLRRTPSTATQLGETLTALLNGARLVAGRYMGFVPMDVLWLALREKDLDSYVVALLPPLEQARPWSTMYSDLIPTLGPPAVSLLIARMRDAKDDNYFFWEIAKGISAIGGAAARSAADTLLRSDDPKLLRVPAYVIFAWAPARTACKSAHAPSKDPRRSLGSGALLASILSQRIRLTRNHRRKIPVRDELGPRRLADRVGQRRQRQVNDAPRVRRDVPARAMDEIGVEHEQPARLPGRRDDAVALDQPRHRRLVERP